MEKGILSTLNNKFIKLTREDLDIPSKNLPIEEINYHNFKHESLCRSKREKAIVIYFKDGDRIKELKNRYANSWR